MQLSFSQLSTYRHCPKQYEFAFVKKLPRPISTGESFGSSVHNALKKWGELEMKKNGGGNQLELFVDDAPSDAPEELTLETLLNLWHQSFIVASYESRSEADFDRKRGEKLMEHFFAWWGEQERKVVAIEKGFKMHTDSSVITGRFDRIEESGDGVRVIDFKTGNLRSQEAVDSDLQLSIYALAAEEVFQKPCHALTLLFISEDGLSPIETKRTKGQLKDALTHIAGFAGRIESKEYQPAPSREKCGHCPYKNVCDAAMK